MLNKDVLHSKMRRRIENPRILLLDCPLEYTKGENNIVMDITKDNDWTALLKAEEEWVKKTCDYIIALKPDLVITEKGISGNAPLMYLTPKTAFLNGFAFLCYRPGPALLREKQYHSTA